MVDTTQWPKYTLAAKFFYPTCSEYGICGQNIQTSMENQTELHHGAGYGGVIGWLLFLMMKWIWKGSRQMNHGLLTNSLWCSNDYRTMSLSLTLFFLMLPFGFSYTIFSWSYWAHNGGGGNGGRQWGRPRWIKLFTCSYPYGYYYTIESRLKNKTRRWQNWVGIVSIWTAAKLLLLVWLPRSWRKTARLVFYSMVWRKHLCNSMEHGWGQAWIDHHAKLLSWWQEVRLGARISLRGVYPVDGKSHLRRKHTSKHQSWGVLLNVWILFWKPL